MRYSLWTLEDESIYTVRAYKAKDTNSSKEVDKWMENGGVASFYRTEDELNAMYLQTFQQ